MSHVIRKEASRDLCNVGDIKGTREGDVDDGIDRDSTVLDRQIAKRLNPSDP